MSVEDDLLASLLEMETPAIDPAFADKVRRTARAELVPAAAGEVLPVRLLLSGAVVPALLVSAAVVHGAEWTGTAAKIFRADDQEGGSGSGQ
jgi:hypothetical protein